MNILFISEYLPYFPCYDGFRLIPYNIMKGLSKNHNLHLVSFINSHEEVRYKEKLSEFCNSVETIFYNHNQNLIKKAKNLFSLYAWENSMFEHILRAIKEHDIDLIYVEGANVAHYVRNIGGIPKILCPHDSPSARALALFRLEKSIIKKIKCFIDYRKAISYEKIFYGNFNHCVVVSESDKEMIQKHCPHLKISVMSNGVDSDYYAYRKFEPRNNRLIFTGNMSYEPNIDAVLYFYKNILPLIRKHIDDFQFYIVGANPSKAILNLRNDKSIIVTGRVDDIRNYIYESTIYVCPMRRGTGIKNKILEAMSMGIPIVATSTSVEGINVTNDKDIFIEDQPKLFAERVCALQKNRDIRNMLSKNGRRLINTEYGWHTRVAILEQIISNIKENSEEKEAV